MFRLNSLPQYDGIAGEEDELATDAEFNANDEETATQAQSASLMPLWITLAVVGSVVVIAVAAFYVVRLRRNKTESTVATGYELMQ